MKNENQLEIPVAIERRLGDNYWQALIEYNTIDQKYAPVFFVYCGQSKKYFVSKFTTRQGVEKYPTNRIIK